MKKFTYWNKVIKLDHGYDENKPASQLNIEDMKGLQHSAAVNAYLQRWRRGIGQKNLNSNVHSDIRLAPVPNWFLREDISALNVNVKAGITKNALNVNRFSPKCGALFKARMMDENIKKLYLN
ncbi:hypothetical protein IM700_011635 [Paenibacillus sp. DXFW5]|jgi:hypothetical protein|uniref:Uncharacterized protein n=1 Tax=Paenibacillus rhizolycopersici TaxID=2780073 RepID=A0ABS2H8H5_9BACL|nr:MULTISPECIES: hypothetical protein [Paenibacillus]MBM6996299.1 hypothetical protein [Paenibacillus rhizolycopersici]